MTEREYAIATNIRALDLALKALSTVGPDSPVVDRAELTRIYKTLDDWRDKSYAMLKLR